MVCCTGVLGAKTRSGWIATALVPLLCHYDIIQLQYHTAMAYHNTNHGLLSPYILSPCGDGGRGQCLPVSTPQFLTFFGAVALLNS